jgi:hypothetical protein
MQTELDTAIRALEVAAAILNTEVRRPPGRNNVQYSCISHSFVTICADKRKHAKSVGKELVRQDSGVNLDFDHINCYNAY